MKEEQIKQKGNISNWLNKLMDYPKGTGKLAVIDRDSGIIKHCCLGVYTLCLDPEETADDLVRNADGYLDMSLLNIAGLNSYSGQMEKDGKRCMLEISNGLGGNWNVETLISLNDRVTRDEKDFRSMKMLMLVTMEYWIKDKQVCEAIQQEMADEIKQADETLKKDGWTIKYLGTFDQLLQGDANPPA
jgi:hypothetical protein